jgi:phosphomannomutase
MSLSCSSTWTAASPTIIPIPPSQNLAQLVKAVKDKGADLGVAFDGDADRIGAVDDQGTVIYGDQLMIIYARDSYRKPGATLSAK